MGVKEPDWETHESGELMSAETDDWIDRFWMGVVDAALNEASEDDKAVLSGFKWFIRHGDSEPVDGRYPLSNKMVSGEKHVGYVFYSRILNSGGENQGWNVDDFINDSASKPVKWMGDILKEFVADLQVVH